MGKIPIDKYRLRFPDDLEKDFLADYFHKSLFQLRLAIILLTIIYACFGIVDAMITPEIKTQAWLIRFALVVPGCIGIFLFSFSPYFKKYIQPAMFGLVLLVGWSIVALCVITRPPASDIHFAGLILFIMGAYLMSKLRFLYMSTVAWAIVAAYEVAAYAMDHTQITVFLANNVIYIAANLVGMFSSYTRELYLRRDFFYHRTVQELEGKKHHLEKEQLQQAVDVATKSLQESEARFRTLAETTTAAIFIHQGERLLYVNPAGEKTGGYTSEELLKKDFWTFIHPDYQEMVRSRGKARVAGEPVPSEYEFKFIRKDGEVRWGTLTTGFIEYKGIPAIIATLFDITDLKQANEERVRLYEERIAEEKRHIMEKEKLMMDLHDGIGGITTNISILAELAQKAKEIDSVNKTLVTISQLSREGSSEIRSFMQSLDSAELSWHALTAELRKQGATLVEPHCIRFAAETSVADAIEQPGSLLWVNLLRIYKEALTNVVKHSQAGSVAVTFNADDKGLQLIVQDDGIGLDENMQHGRGLPNMKRRMREMGGELTISTSRKQGTQVMLAMPLPIRYPLSGMDL